MCKNISLPAFLIVFLFLYTTSNKAISQTWKELNKEVVKYYEQVNYKKAIEYAEKAFFKAEKEFGKEHTNYIVSCINLAELYRNAGKNKESERLFKEAKKIIEKLYGKDHPAYALNCNNLAVLYSETGNYLNAEALLIEAKNIRENYFGKQHHFYAESCNNLAGLYFSMANYEKAELLLIESNEIYKKVFGEEHQKYAGSCNNLAEYYKTIGNYEKAKLLTIEAKDIRHKVFGKEHPKYALSCNNLAGIYFESGKYKKAEKLFIEAKDIYEHTEGKEHIQYAFACNNLAVLSFRSGNYDKAELLFKEGRNIVEKKFGKKHPNYVESCLNLALLYHNIGDSLKNADSKSDYYFQAEILYAEVCGILNSNIRESAKFLSEKERERYLSKRITNKFDVCNSYFLTKRKENKRLPGILYNNSLNIKGQLLESSLAIRKIVLQSGDTSLINSYNRMNDYGKILTKQYALPFSERRSDINDLEEKLNTLEKEIIRNCQPYSDVSKTGKIFWQSIRMSLKKEDIAIEFIHFRYHNKKHLTDSTLYYALVLRSDFKNPEAVFLFEQEQLEKILHRPANISEYEYIKQLYDSKSKKADSLFKLVWDPLEQYLQNTKNIYISPTGLLNKISFDAIPYKSEKILSDKYKIIYTTSTSELKNKTSLFLKDLGNSALFGGIEYNIDIEEMEKSAKEFHKSSSETAGNSSLASLKIDSLSRNLSWSYLPGSLKETESIKEILTKGNIDVKLYSAEKGSEEQFKALEINAPDIMHISTHGFYFGEDDKTKEYKNTMSENIKFVHSYNPLLRSGFILAGGNKTFQGDMIPEGIEDGVLTALEISKLNLFNTKLVVLSACQTGLGDIKGNEGVYGLQRSFKMAGVDYLLFSLWSVPDETTKELMTNFYSNWFSGMEIRDAFKKAQEHLKIKYAGVPGSAFAWAAFVLMK